MSFGLRWDEPLSRLEGTGARLVIEGRALRPLGPLRLFYGFDLGFAGCRGADCPPVDFSNSDEEESQGLFVMFGGELGIDRRIWLGRWSLGLTLGGKLSGFHLGAHGDYVGEQNGGLAGPFASIGLYGPGGTIVPGFSPAARRPSNGPEIVFQRVTAFGRGPTESAWLLGFGWRVEGPN